MKLLITIAAVLMVWCGPPQRPGISIYDAAWGGNIEAVKQHIAAGTDVNTKDDIGDTPLDVAIQLKQTEIAERLRNTAVSTVHFILQLPVETLKQ